MEPSVLDIVRTWHIALNNNKPDQLIALVHEDVEVGGPRGITRGAQVVREWIGRANLHLNPIHYYNRENIVIVEEQGEWHSASTSQVIGSQVVATVFVVTNGRISRIMRYDDLETAFKEAGLDKSDRVEAGDN